MLCYKSGMVLSCVCGIARTSVTVMVGVPVCVEVTFSFCVSLALGDVDYTVACVLYVTLSVVWVWSEVRVDLALDDVT